MAAALFALYFLVLILALVGQRMVSLVLACITLLLSIGLFIHHITERLSINL